MLAMLPPPEACCHSPGLQPPPFYLQYPQPITMLCCHGSIHPQNY